MSTVLIAEDDRRVRDSLERALRFEGFDVVVAADGVEALHRHADEEPDVIVLDIMMPQMDGLEVCRKLRRQGHRTPILMLTARHEIDDRVAGLDAGADDYLPKPFALDELLARLRALLRRTAADADAQLEFDDLVLNRHTRRVTRGEDELELTKTEFTLLELFLANTNRVLTREVIYERVWGIDFETSSNSLDVYIGYLRRKTEANDKPRLIHTVRGVGYVLRDE